MIDHEGLERRLCCPACRGGLESAAAAWCCAGCGSEFPLSDGIADLAAGPSLPSPRIYQDPHFLQYLASLDEAQEYFYRPGSLLSWVQNAGQRAASGMLKGKTHRSLLELGCGTGALIPWLSGPSGYLGVDLDLGSLKALARRYPGYRVLRADCCRLPLRDASVERLVSVYHLEHLVHLDLVCEEMERVLKPDGELVVSVPNEGGLAWELGRRLSSARHFGTDSYDYLRAVSIAHLNCAWQLERTLKRHFRVLQTSRFPLGAPSFHLNLVTTYRLAKRAISAGAGALHGGRPAGGRI